MERYLVEFKSFKTHEWYEKKRKNSIGAACSVSSCDSWGRATLVIDTETGETIRETEEDASMATCNGYVK